MTGQALLRFPAFYETVEKCDMILRTRGMRVIDVLTSKHEAIFNNILNSLVGITVMQVMNYPFQLLRKLYANYIIYLEFTKKKYFFVLFRLD